MRVEYFINEMLRKVDFAIINTYLVKNKKKEKMTYFGSGTYIDKIL